MTLHSLPSKVFALAILSLYVALDLSRGEAVPPAPKNYFNDYAGVISQSKQHELNALLVKFEKDTTNQVLVAIFPKMDSTLPLDDYTLLVANTWGVGQRDKNNGVTLFVFIHDRKMRIQVGSGITGVLTNDVCKRIIDQDLKPRFQKADFDGGLTAGVDSILRILAKQQSDEAGTTN